MGFWPGWCGGALAVMPNMEIRLEYFESADAWPGWYGKKEPRPRLAGPGFFRQCSMGGLFDATALRQGLCPWGRYRVAGG